MPTPLAPPTSQFERALAAHRALWANHGYYTSDRRFIATYDLLRRHYRGGTIVDVGAWPGDFACTLASMGLPVTVIDKDPSRGTAKVVDPETGEYRLGGTASLVDKCAQHSTPVVQCDIERERFPLNDGAVGLVICTEVLSHLRVGLLHTLRECRRVLAPEGRLLITTPHMASLTNRLSLLFGGSEYEGLMTPFDALAAEERIGHGGMYRLFTMPELHDLLTRCGFSVAAAGYWHLAPTPPLRSLYGLRRAVLNACSSRIGPFGNALFAVAGPDVPTPS